MSLDIARAECVSQIGASVKLALALLLPTILAIAFLAVAFVLDVLVKRKKVTMNEDNSAISYQVVAEIPTSNSSSKATARNESPNLSKTSLPKSKWKYAQKSRTLKKLAFLVTTLAYGYQIPMALQSIPCNQNNRRLYFDSTSICASFQGFEKRKEYLKVYAANNPAAADSSSQMSSLG